MTRYLFPTPHSPLPTPHSHLPPPHPPPPHSPLPPPHSPLPTQPRLFSVKNDIASMRVRSSFLKTPRTAEVMVVAPAFLTPRIVMQRWSASITTITPFGCRSP